MSQRVPHGQIVIPTRSIGWMRGGEALVAQLAPNATSTDRPSLLPGWTRERVLSHLAGNGRALSNLLDWARTGIQTPMYAGPGSREGEIDRWCGVGDEALLAHLDDIRRQLDDRIWGLPDEAWDTKVQTNSGRTVEASFVPWMRVREVWIHAVDLDCGVTFADVPADIRTALLDEIVADLSAKEGCPGLNLQAADERWQLAGGGDDAVAPDSARLLAWLTGRSTGADVRSSVQLPPLPRWL